jgi:hypothetical protein
MGFVVDKVALGQVFSKYFGFPCQFSVHQLLHNHHHLSSGAGKICQLLADVPIGLSLTSPQEEACTQLVLLPQTLEYVKGDVSKTPLRLSRHLKLFPV